MPFKPATVPQIKKELSYLSQNELITLCLRLTKYKLENKELVSYLLFENNEIRFRERIKEEIDEQLRLVNQVTFYYTKKGAPKSASLH